MLLFSISLKEEKTLICFSLCRARKTSKAASSFGFAKIFVIAVWIKFIFCFCKGEEGGVFAKAPTREKAKIRKTKDKEKEKEKNRKNNNNKFEKKSTRRKKKSRKEKKDKKKREKGKKRK